MYSFLPAKLLRALLLVIEVFIAITAVMGGYGLVFGNAYGLPLSYLNGSPFASYVIPGFFLGVVVAGTNLIAALTNWKKKKYMYEASFIAGFAMMIFEFVESYITRQPHPLQLFYFFLGVLLLSITFIMLRKEKT